MVLAFRNCTSSAPNFCGNLFLLLFLFLFFLHDLNLLFLREGTFHFSFVRRRLLFYVSFVFCFVFCFYFIFLFSTKSEKSVSTNSLASPPNNSSNGAGSMVTQLLPLKLADKKVSFPIKWECHSTFDLPNNTHFAH